MAYNIDDIILSEYGTTVVGLEMLRAVNEESAEENRKLAAHGVHKPVGALLGDDKGQILVVFQHGEVVAGVIPSLGTVPQDFGLL